MNVDFEQIALSRSEFALLKRLSKDSVCCKPKMVYAVGRLEHFEFAKSGILTGDVEHQKKRFKMPDGTIIIVTITELGKDYYNFQKAQKAKSRSAKFHDIIVAIIGAAVGCILILVFQAALILLRGT